jgi:hypothetical protein
MNFYKERQHMSQSFNKVSLLTLIWLSKVKRASLFLLASCILSILLPSQSLYAQVFKPQPNIADDSGNWSSSTAAQLEIKLDGFSGIFISEFLGIDTTKIHHAQHIVRLPNVTGEDGKTRAYFAITHSNKIFNTLEYFPDGYWMVAEINPESYDAATDQLIDMPGSDGQYVYEEHFTRSRLTPFGFTGGRNEYADQLAERPEQFVISSAGDWNHPGKMAGFDGILLMAAQQFSGLVGTEPGDDPDAVLFYDVRNPLKPIYLGLVDAIQLGLPSKLGGGRDAIASVGLSKSESGYYHMGIEYTNYICHEDTDCFAAPMNNEQFFIKWKPIQGDFNSSGQLGQIFHSREIYDEMPVEGEACFEDDNVICQPPGTVRSIFFVAVRDSIFQDSVFSDDNANKGIPAFVPHMYSNSIEGDFSADASFTLNADTQSFKPMDSASNKNKFYNQLIGDCAPNGGLYVTDQN